MSRSAQIRKILKDNPKVSYVALARELGCSHQVVSEVALRMGLRKRRSPS
jgi:DNA-binding Lrp family transcriptional regulator